MKEAKTMKFYPSNTDLVCLCKVDLPNLVADIESDQFYIMLNVVRNVLLSPPPVSAAAERRRKERDGKEEEKSKRMQIHRRADLLQRHDIRVLPVLDLNTKASRDEVKVLIEETIKEPLEIEEGNTIL